MKLFCVLKYNPISGNRIWNCNGLCYITGFDSKRVDLNITKKYSAVKYNGTIGFKHIYIQSMCLQTLFTLYIFPGTWLYHTNPYDIHWKSDSLKIRLTIFEWHLEYRNIKMYYTILQPYLYHITRQTSTRYVHTIKSVSYVSTYKF